MLLQIMSDLHLEFGEFTPPKTNADVVILAGDIHVKQYAIKWALKHFTVPVIYIAGNHEHYGSTLNRTPEKLKLAAAGTNVHFLQNDSLVIDGVRFIGTTLWTDYRLTGNQPLAEIDAMMRLEDFNFIRNKNFRKIRPYEILEEHQRAKNFIVDTLNKPFEGKTVVVGHHAPDIESIPKRFLNDGTHLSSAYASNLDRLMGGESIVLWVHGHVHDSMDYDKYGTRVICNPRGYAPKDLNPGFNPELVIEI